MSARSLPVANCRSPALIVRDLLLAELLLRAHSTRATQQHRQTTRKPEENAPSNPCKRCCLCRPFASCSSFEYSRRRSWTGGGGAAETELSCSRRDRGRRPLPHVAVQVPHVSQLAHEQNRCSWHSRGQAPTSRAACGPHANPPCFGCWMIWRKRSLSPPHLPHSPQAFHSP